VLTIQTIIDILSSEAKGLNISLPLLFPKKFIIILIKYKFKAMLALIANAINFS